MLEHKAAPGGTLTQLDVQYPTIDCGACQAQDSLAGPPWPEARCLRTGLSHPMITTLTSTTLKVAERQGDGGFEVTLEQGRRWIDAERCTGCGDFRPSVVSCCVRSRRWC